MQYDPCSFDQGYVWQEETLSQYTIKTFLWMFLGLAVTFTMALAMVTTNLIRWVFIPGAHIILLLAELLVVYCLGMRVQNLSVRAARGLFLFYSILNGAVCSTLFLVYDLGILVFTFAAAGLYFGVLALYGYVTKSDLSRLMPIFTVGLITLLVFWLLSMFFNLSPAEGMMCLFGIALFLGLTAYDTQMIRRYYDFYCDQPDTLKKASIFSALQLYLDFINLFLHLLRFLVRSKKN